ncbi:MAG: DUF4123 domain-containing protein [Pseudomonadota bacterium]
MIDADRDDYWVNGYLEGGGRTGPEPCLVQDMIEPVQPLDRQFGAHPLKTVPDVLAPVLFPDDAPEAATYAVLDGALIPFLTDRLGVSGLPHESLFQDAAAAEMGDVGPWLVRLDQGSAFARDMFTHLDDRSLWALNPGILLRATASFEAVRRHLRRFVRIRDAQGHWFYWRFYDPATLSRYLSGPPIPRTTRLQFFEGGTISAIFCRSDRVMAMFSVTDSDQIQRQPVVLLDEERLSFRLMMHEREADRLARDLHRTLPDILGARTHRESVEVLAAALVRLECYGFDRAGDREIMAAWDLVYGQPFETLDTSGQLQQLCASTGRSQDRFERIMARMETLTRQAGEERS